MKVKSFVKSGDWLRKKPLVVMRPGFIEVHSTLEPLAVSRRWSSFAKKTLQSLLSLYALSGSNAPPASARSA
jgi:hypothetical protein